MKPPICAHQATPPPVDGMNSSAAPCSICITNQNPTYKIAGISKKNGMMMIGTRTIRRAVGNRRT